MQKLGDGLQQKVALVIVHAQKPHAGAIDHDVEHAVEQNAAPGGDVGKAHDAKPRDHRDHKPLRHGQDLPPEIRNIETDFSVIIPEMPLKVLCLMWIR